MKKSKLLTPIKTQSPIKSCRLWPECVELEREVVSYLGIMQQDVVVVVVRRSCSSPVEATSGDNAVIDDTELVVHGTVPAEL